MGCQTPAACLALAQRTCTYATRFTQPVTVMRIAHKCAYENASAEITAMVVLGASGFPREQATVEANNERGAGEGAHPVDQIWRAVGGMVDAVVGGAGGGRGGGAARGLSGAGGGGLRNDSSFVAGSDAADGRVKGFAGGMVSAPQQGMFANGCVVSTSIMSMITLRVLHCHEHLYRVKRFASND